MLFRAFLVRLLLLVLAVFSGTFRQAVLLPRLGDGPAQALSTVLLSALLLTVAWFSMGYLRIETTREAWLVGLLWLGLTVAFELLAGHYLFGSPWSKLLAD